MPAAKHGRQMLAAWAVRLRGRLAACPGVRPLWSCALLWALVLLAARPALAGGPRYVTGPPFFTARPGQPVGWRQAALTYFTDPADLSASVNHAAADALVLSAASVWNVPTASVTLSRGGALAEHVSGGNTYLSSVGMLYPPDVSSANAANVPIAVVYDTDGSITDLLLGSGASSPSSCRQNAVTESVDRFDPAGYILHALIVVNGRCTGTAAAAQQELRYKLIRIFGRVLGLAWSQTNDNVFTGVPVPTPQQAGHWPLMHPIDINCGPYAYQCLPSPFTLRDDDLSALALVYPIADGSAPQGKQPNPQPASAPTGTISFPTGQGMAGVNVVARRRYINSFSKEPFFDASAVTGFGFRRADVPPLLAAGTDAMASMGAPGYDFMGYYRFGGIPLLPGTVLSNLELTLEPVNPLYMGLYGLGPYNAGTVRPSGTAPDPIPSGIVYAGATPDVRYTVLDAASTCGNGSDGTLTVPAPADGSGTWTGLLCGYRHAAYASLPVRAGRSFTVEVTALDEAGAPTTTKAMPLIGVYGPADSALPSVALTSSAFQSRAAATTQVTATVDSSAASSTLLRLAVADQRGDGRPDFRYRARVLYADTVSPAQVPDAGGTVTLTGMGFRPGNTLSVHGVAATVLSASANSLTAVLPSASAAHLAANTPADLVVTDLATGGTTTLFAVMSYGPAQPPTRVLKLIAAPAGNAYVGDPAAIAFTMQVLAADATTPVAGERVTLATSAGTVSFAACGAPRCVLVSDANGMVASALTPATAGTITLSATAGTGALAASFTALPRAGSIRILVRPPSTSEVLGPMMLLGVQVLSVDGDPMPNRLVSVTTPVGAALFDACQAPTCDFVTDNLGVVPIRFTPTRVGPLTVRAAQGSVFAEVALTATDNTDTMVVTHAPAAHLLVSKGESFYVRLLRHDGTTPDSNQPVVFSAPAGVVFGGTGSNVSKTFTDSNGVAGLAFYITQPGSYTLQAAFGDIQQTVSVTVTAPYLYLRAVSVPTGKLKVRQWASDPVVVQLLNSDGDVPVPGYRMGISTAADDALFDLCLGGGCPVVTDGNGMVAAKVYPLHAGTIPITFNFPGQSLALSVVAEGSVNTMSVVARPPATGLRVGENTSFTVKVTGPDGTTPVEGEWIAFTTIAGSFRTGNCGYGTCTAATDPNGLATMSGVGEAPGAVTVLARAEAEALEQRISFDVSADAPVMRLVGAPSGSVQVGDTATVPMTVQMLARDGVTPLPGETVIFSVTAGSARLGACGAGTCSVRTDAQGYAATTVTPSAAGAVALQAADGAALQSASFTAVARPDVLRVVSAPANGSYTGVAAATRFAVQVLLADGVTPAAARNVTLSVTQGAATLDACGGTASCVLRTDAQGMVGSAVTPRAGTSITLAADDAGVQVTASFNAVDRPATMALVLRPADGAFTGMVAAASFVVRVVDGDGVTPLSGLPVTLSVTAGSARLEICGAVTQCSATTGPDGSVSTRVTPLAAGSIGLRATSGMLRQDTAFQAVPPPDMIEAVSAPADGALVGDPAATPFAVRVRLADGSPAAQKSVTLSVTQGTAVLNACGSAVCTVSTDALGMASSAVTPTAAGTVGLRAREADAVVDRSFRADAKPDTLELVSAPADGAWVGERAGLPIAVRVRLSDGTPAAGKTVTLAVTQGSATLSACGAALCTVTTDASGLASSSVTPLLAGVVGLRATEGSLAVAASFRADDRADTLEIVSAPADGALVGDRAPVPFAVRVRRGDGSLAQGKAVALSVAQGSATLALCGGPVCSAVTDSLGMVSTGVTPLAAGGIVLRAVDAGVVATASFRADAKPDTLELVSAPADGSLVGDRAAVAFAVRVRAGDGTPAASKNVTLLVTQGAATLLACAGKASCTLVTDAAGLVQSAVTPLQPGQTTLHAQAGTAVVDASFRADAKPDTLELVSAPADGSLVGDRAATSFTVRVRHGDGTVAAQTQVSFAVTLGSASLGACSTAPCTLLTDSAGLASKYVTPSAPGATTLRASVGMAVVDSTFRADAKPDTLELVSAPADGSLVGDRAALAFAVRVRAGDGTPAAAKNVTLSVTQGAATLLACAGKPICTLVSDATGLVQSAVTPLQPGATTLHAQAGTAVVDASFRADAKPDTLELVSAPADGSVVDAPAALPFAVRLLAGDGTPRAGQAVRFQVAQGGATLGSCAGSTCSVTTDAAGLAQTSVTPRSAGGILLTASAGALVRSAGFNTVAAPRSLHLLSVPEDGAWVGSPAVQKFSVRVLEAAGTPAAGRTVTLSVVAGSARLEGCTGVSVCTLVSDLDGVVSTAVTPLLAGTVSLAAAEGANNLQASFAARTQPATLRVATAPADGAWVGEPAPVPFAVQMLVAGQPVAGRSVRLAVSAGKALLSACGQPSCVLPTDAQGMVATAVVPGAAGTIGLHAEDATDATVEADASFAAQARPDLLRVAQALPVQVFVGDAPVFTVAALLADGVSPAPGRSVTFAVVSGGATLGCGGAACTVLANAQGLAAVTLGVPAAGAFTVRAQLAAATVESGSTARTRPDVLSLVSAPAALEQGSTAATALRVRLLAADGTPRAGAELTFAAAGSGAASFGVCSASTCRVVTDAAGYAGTSVSGVAPGQVALRVSAGAAEVVPVEIDLLVTPERRTLTLAEPATYVAEGAVFQRRLHAQLTRNGAPAAGQALHWQGTGAAAPDQADTAADATGTSFVTATLGPLASGARATVTVCGWPGVCAESAAVGVAETAWRLDAVAGQTQTVRGTAYAPVRAQVTDGQGHGVAGAVVSVHQTVVADPVPPCPAQGRCPAEPVLATEARALVSDENGFVSVVPRSVDDQPSTTRLLFSSGVNGALSVVLARQP